MKLGNVFLDRSGLDEPGLNVSGLDVSVSCLCGACHFAERQAL